MGTVSATGLRTNFGEGRYSDMLVRPFATLCSSRPVGEERVEDDGVVCFESDSVLMPCLSLPVILLGQKRDFF